MTGRPTKQTQARNSARPSRVQYPFAAIVGQEEMKLALLLNVIAPSVGGVLIMGERGTGKTTAVRALADLLPPIPTVRDCPFNCDPVDDERLCDNCRALKSETTRLPRASVRVPVVELPLGATEDRVCGTLDVGRALREGGRHFEPGLLARANRGFLYIDEVNLLEDHLVDLLLDVSVAGVNRVEREGVSLEHQSRFVLVGSGNPEEGDLRPQLLDRFGLSVEVKTPADIDGRVEVVERNERFARDPKDFAGKFEGEQSRLRRRLARARGLFASAQIPRGSLRKIAELCQRLGVDGHRGELTVARAARALAAFEGRRDVSENDVRRVAALALRHRLRRDPLENSPGGGRISDGLEEIFGSETTSRPEADLRPRERPNSAENTDKKGQRPKKRVDAESEAHSEVDANYDFGGAHESEIENRPAPPVDVRPDLDALKLPAGVPAKGVANTFRSRRAAGGRASDKNGRGRQAGVTLRPDGHNSVALAATLRVAAGRLAASRAPDNSRPLRVTAGDVRYKRFKIRAGTLYVFAVDTSGSMALNRIGQAKGLLGGLLRSSYVNRDRVALVSFRGATGEVLLRPSRSSARAKRILDSLPVGGATPLPAGLLRSLELVRRAKDEGTRRIVLMVLTDGRGNVPLADKKGEGRATARARVKCEVQRLGLEIRGAGITSVVVDTGNRFAKGGDGHELADALGGRYVNLPSALGENSIEETLGLKHA